MLYTIHVMSKGHQVGRVIGKLNMEIVMW